VEIGTLLGWQDGFDTLVSRAREAEELGFGFLGVGDSINRDPYPALGVLARETKTAMIGTTVTNPVTRHPRVTASAIATVDEIAGGRAVLGIGRGFSSVLDIGAIPATSLEVSEYIQTLRALLAGRTAKWKGESTQLRWVRRPVPVLLSAYGRRTRRLAGECADGVILTSARIDLLMQGIDEVRSAASASGRDPDQISIWLMVRGSVSDDRYEAIGHHKATLAAAALNLPTGDSDLTPTLRKAISELRSRYRIDEHAVGHGVNAQLLDELGLTEYLAGRFCVAGTPAECRKKVLDIATTGVDLLYFVIDHGGTVDPASMTRRLAKEVCVEFLRPPASSRREESTRS
jgi:5,10-methylenetetrahydromethanopterin reductase